MERRRNSRQAPKQWSNIILTTLGIGVGLSGFFAGFHFKNMHTGIWSLVSGVFAGATLHLAILQKTGYLSSWYSPQMLCNIIKLGAIGSIAGLAGAVTYLTISIVEHHGSQLSTSFYFSAVGSILTFIWSLYLVILAWRLKNKFDNQYSRSCVVLNSTATRKDTMAAWFGFTISLLGFLFMGYVQPQDYPFRDPNLPWDVRVDDLVSRLTFDEIVLQLAKGGTDPGAGPAPAIPRLGINPYGWNTECLHGDANSGPATAFPQSIGLAATFSTDVLFRMAQATSYEVRAKFNNFSAAGEYGTHKGASCFSPVINIMRHPLWGRCQETYGEDPYLSGQLVRAYVQGLQGDDPRYIRANAGCKHFDAYGGPENIPESSFSFDAEITERDWRLTFLPAFEACVKAGTYSLMCSFNSINGVPACVNDKLLTEILRNEWGFTGYVISDEDAIEYVYTQHHYLPDAVSTAAACIKAGCNLELSTTNPNNTYQQIPAAVEQGLLDEATVNETVKPLFYTRMRLGEFDPPSMNPYASLKPEDYVQSPEHQALALEFAMKSFVLLQNSENLLPLKQTSYGIISVIGPMADNPGQTYGTYTPDYDPNHSVTPYGGLKVLATQTNLVWGCNDTKCNYYDAASVKNALVDTELIFLCLGTGPDVEAEGNDRSNMDFPGQQGQLLKDVVDTNAGRVPIILLLFNAGPLQMDSATINSVQAIMECFFPAQAAGDAIRKVLLNDGDFSNPAGRLPYTWPASMAQVPEMTNYTMYNRTYRYWNQDPPTFPFGYGLSYTTFSYSDLILTPKVISPGDNVTVQAKVTNTGGLDGDEVIQAYIAWPDATEPMPKLQLVYFERVLISSSGSYDIEFVLTADKMAVYEDDAGFVVRPGRIDVYVGGQQPIYFPVLTDEFQITE